MRKLRAYNVHFISMTQHP